MRVRKPPLEDSDLAMRAFGPDEMILVASPEFIAAHGEPQTLEDIGRMPTLFDVERRRALDLALRQNGWRARRTDTLAAPMHGRSLHAAARGAARDWCSPYPTSRRCERFGGRHARPTAAVAEGSRGSHARDFPVAARNDSRAARARRPPLRDCAPAPELASQHSLYFGAPPRIL